MDPELGVCLSHKRRRELGEYSADGGDQAGFGVVEGHVGDVLDVWPNEVVQRVQVGGGGGSERRVQSRSTPSGAKPGSLWTCELTPSPAATTRISHRPPHCTRRSLHSSAHPGTLCCWLSSQLRRCELARCSLPLHHFQRFVRCVEICPQALNCLDLHFEGAGNGPVVISWIGRERELYSSESPISLVKHCVTFRHDRRLLSLLGFVHNWPTSRWSATKKENRFLLNGNGIMSFQGRQFYRSTLYFLVKSRTFYGFIYVSNRSV